MSEDRNMKPADTETRWGHLLTVIEGLVRAHSHIADVIPAVGTAGVNALKSDAARLREMVSPPPVEHDPGTAVSEPGEAVAHPPSDQGDPDGPEDPADHSADALNSDQAANNPDGLNPVITPEVLDEIEAKADEKSEEYAQGKKK